MELLAGKLDVLLPNREKWISIEAGQTFDIPAHAKFNLVARGLTDYCCSYVKA